MTKTHAIGQLTSILTPGDTLHLIDRGHTRRMSRVVDVVLPPTLHIGEYVAALLSLDYSSLKKGIVLQPGRNADHLIDGLSLALFGERNQFTVIWL